jgi:hypothetical protein
MDQQRPLSTSSVAAQRLQKPGRLPAAPVTDVKPALKVVHFFEAQYAHVAATSRTHGSVFLGYMVVANQFHTLIILQSKYGSWILDQFSLLSVVRAKNMPS